MLEDQQIYLPTQQIMYSSRPNPIIKFYLKNKRPIEVESGRQYSFLQMKCLDMDLIEPSNYIEEHRQRIMLDYQKKLTEIKTIKHKFNGDGKRTSNIHSLSFRAKTSRESTMRSKKSKSLDRAPLSLSTEVTQKSYDERSLKHHMLNLTQIQYKKQQQVSSQKPLTSFQKSTMKRLRAREEVTLKKKFISFNIDQKHQTKVSPKKPSGFADSFRFFTECTCQ